MLVGDGLTEGEVYVSFAHDKIERKLEEKNEYEKGI
jgi:hypothetical protein